jgi:hypothetical protein
MGNLWVLILLYLLEKHYGEYKSWGFGEVKGF